MISLKNLRISRKLVIGFAAMIAVSAGTGATALINIDIMNKARAESRESNDVLTWIADAQFRLARQENSVRGWIISHDEYYLERVETHRGKFKDALNEIRALAGDKPEQLQRIDAVERAADLWYDGIVPITTRLVRDPATRGQAGALVGNNGQADQLIAPAEEGIDAMIEAERATVEELQAASQAAALTVFWVILGGLLASTLLSIAIGVGLTRMIARPVALMTEAMRKLAGGDKAIDIPAVGQKDEVGDMAEAVMVFRDAAIALDQAEIARAAAEREQAEVVDSLADALERVAKGDLTSQVQAQF
ncbi:MAG TPA: CHASE3 domain-containing protein, partial [Terricaulis sp.]|nr:CHASE3 domain-containing protein [Terricaulis sp.]